jgi:hypothetical protein
MDLASTFNEVVRLVHDATDPVSGWSSLIGYLENRAGDQLSIPAVSAGEDVRGLREQLEALVKAEPPPADLNAVYFGLFDTTDDGGREGIGYYVAGVEKFDPDDGDSLCSPAWWPEGRYLASAALNSIKEAELSSAAAGKEEVRCLLSYTGQLGAALLVSRFAARGLFLNLTRVVGFDSGDFAEMAP